MLEKIYGLVDFITAAVLLFGLAPGPAILIYACATMLALKGLMSFVPIPLYMPGFLMCGTDILAAMFLFFSNIALPAKTIIIAILLFKSVPCLVFNLFGK